MKALSPLEIIQTQRGRRGAAMVTTLITVSLGSLAAAGIATVTLSGYSRTLADQNSARALDLAESAALFQMQRIQATDGEEVKYTGSNLEAATYGLRANPLPLAAKGYNGQATANLNQFMGLNMNRGDYARAWIEHPDNPAQDLTVGTEDDVYIYGEARIGGVWRRVRYTVGSGATFDKYTTFGYTEVDYSGKLSCLPLPTTTTSRPGCVSSTRKISCRHPQNQIGKQCTYGNAEPEPRVPETVNGGKTCGIPPIKTVANRCHTGKGYLSIPEPGYTGIKKFCGRAQNSGCNDNFNYGWTRSSSNGSWERIHGDGNLPVRTGRTCQLYGKSQNSPCNFYLKRLKGEDQKINCDVRNGPINIWVDSDEDEDELTGDLNITAYDSFDRFGNPVTTYNACKKVRIYYSNPKPNACLKLNTSSNSRICGSVYSFDRDEDDEATPRGTIEVKGTCKIFGGLACNKLRGNGNLTVDFPQNTGSDDKGDSYFEMRGGFMEVTPVRGN